MVEREVDGIRFGLFSDVAPDVEMATDAVDGSLFSSGRAVSESNLPLQQAMVGNTCRVDHFIRVVMCGRSN